MHSLDPVTGHLDVLMRAGNRITQGSVSPSGLLYFEVLEEDGRSWRLIRTMAKSVEELNKSLGDLAKSVGIRLD